MDNGSGPYELDPYPYNQAFAYQRSDFNIGRSAKLFGVWQPVIFRGSHGWIEKVAGGWSLSGILNVHSGFGWTPVYSTGNLYYNGSPYSTLRPYYLGGAGHDTGNEAFKSGPGVGNGQNVNFTNIDSTVNQTPTSYSNKYFSVPDYSAALGGGTFPGTSAGVPAPPGVARNSFDGPGYRNVDMTVAKAFGLPTLPVLRENAKIEIRAEAFNLFNLLNFNPTSISNNIAASDFGQARSALGSRTVTLQARFSF
jgi:hypothetical protein